MTGRACCPAVPLSQPPGVGQRDTWARSLQREGKEPVPPPPGNTPTRDSNERAVPPVPPASQGRTGGTHRRGRPTSETLMFGRAAWCWRTAPTLPGATRTSGRPRRRAPSLPPGEARGRARRDDPRWACHAPLRCATYQRGGAERRPAGLTYDFSAVPLAELRGWLEERVGRGAAGSGGGGAPAGGNGHLAAPGGAARPHWDSYHSRDRPAAPAPSTAADSAASMRLLAQRLELNALAEHLRRPGRRGNMACASWTGGCGRPRRGRRRACRAPGGRRGGTRRTVATDWPRALRPSAGRGRHTK